MSNDIHGDIDLLCYTLMKRIIDNDPKIHGIYTELGKVSICYKVDLYTEYTIRICLRIFSRAAYTITFDNDKERYDVEITDREYDSVHKLYTTAKTYKKYDKKFTNKVNEMLEAIKKNNN